MRRSGINMIKIHDCTTPSRSRRSPSHRDGSTDRPGVPRCASVWLTLALAPVTVTVTVINGEKIWVILAVPVSGKSLGTHRLLQVGCDSELQVQLEVGTMLSIYS